MRKCLKIAVVGKVQGVAYRAFVQKQAKTLGIEGTVQNTDDGNVLVYACGPVDQLDKFIDFLYKGSSASDVKDVQAEPFSLEKDFRGVFRIIG
jgi:acylphosphatase